MKHVTVLLTALVLVLGTHTLTKADAPAGVTRWEYKLLGDLASKPTETEKALNALGADGWELVTVLGVGFFKRPMP